jgi:hypothetical protein
MLRASNGPPHKAGPRPARSATFVIASSIFHSPNLPVEVISRMPQGIV